MGSKGPGLGLGLGPGAGAGGGLGGGAAHACLLAMLVLLLPLLPRIRLVLPPSSLAQQPPRVQLGWLLVEPAQQLQQLLLLLWSLLKPLAQQKHPALLPPHQCQEQEWSWKWGGLM